MARPKKKAAKAKLVVDQPVSKVEKKPVENALIKKLSEVEAMSDEEKQAFRQNGGTTIQG